MRKKKRQILNISYHHPFYSDKMTEFKISLPNIAIGAAAATALYLIFRPRPPQYYYGAPYYGNYGRYWTKYPKYFRYIAKKRGQNVQTLYDSLCRPGYNWECAHKMYNDLNWHLRGGELKNLSYLQKIKRRPVPFNKF